MENIVYSKAEQIKNTTTQFGHLVILGAGASKASCIDNPEKRGKVIPLMDDLPKVVDINKYLYDLPRDVKDQDFEQLFSYLHSKEGNSQRIQKIESAIYEFFKSLELPDTPTVYDYLILSLRKKDMIATFNWDPF